MADVSDFALAACTGSAVLAFYERAAWERVFEKVTGKACFTAVLFACGGNAAYRLHHLDLAWMAWKIAGGLGGFALWHLFLAWLTSEKDSARRDISKK